MSFLRNLQAKVLLAALIPGSVILIIVAIIALFQYGATVLTIVEERDEQLAKLTAHQLSDALIRHSRVLETVAGTPEVGTVDTVATRLSLAMARGHLEPFDGGVTLYDQSGRAIWSTLSPEPSLLAHYPGIDTVRTSRTPMYSNVFDEPTTGLKSVSFAVPVLNDRQEFVGVVSGTAALDGQLMGAVLSDSLHVATGTGNLTYLVDGSGRSIFHNRSDLIGQDFTKYPTWWRK